MMDQPETEMSEREEFLTSLMRMTAHDLNNILSPILGYPELLMDSFPEGSQEQEDLVEIQDLANRAIALIKDVQQLIRPELSESKPCSLQNSVREIFSAQGLTKEMQSRMDKIDVQLQLDDELAKISSGPHLLSGLLKNLFYACLCITPDSGKLKVSSKGVGDKAQLTVVFTVSKLKEDEVDRIIEPFFLRKRYCTQLTGLELTVVQDLVRQHQGTFTWTLSGDTLALELTFPFSD